MAFYILIPYEIPFNIERKYIFQRFINNQARVFRNLFKILIF